MNSLQGKVLASILTNSGRGSPSPSAYCRTNAPAPGMPTTVLGPPLANGWGTMPHTGCPRSARPTSTVTPGALPSKSSRGPSSGATHAVSSRQSAWRTTEGRAAKKPGTDTARKTAGREGL